MWITNISSHSEAVHDLIWLTPLWMMGNPPLHRLNICHKHLFSSTTGHLVHRASSHIQSEVGSNTRKTQWQQSNETDIPPHNIRTIQFLPTILWLDTSAATPLIELMQSICPLHWGHGLLWMFHPAFGAGSSGAWSTRTRLVERTSWQSWTGWSVSIWLDILSETARPLAKATIQ